MADYTYFIAGFQAIDSEFLRQMVVSRSTLTPTLLVIEASSDVQSSVAGYTIVISFSDVLSGSNQTLLDGLMAGYITSVSVAKAKKLAALQQSAQDYIDLHYSFLIRTQLMNLYTLAKFDSLTNRAAYIRPGIDWLTTITSYSTTTATAINALTTLTDVQNYVVDVAGNAGADPLLTVGAALQITN